MRAFAGVISPIRGNVLVRLAWMVRFASTALQTVLSACHSIFAAH